MVHAREMCKRHRVESYIKRRKKAKQKDTHQKNGILFRQKSQFIFMNIERKATICFPATKNGKEEMQIQ